MTHKEFLEKMGIEEREKPAGTGAEPKRRGRPPKTTEETAETTEETETAETTAETER